MNMFMHELNNKWPLITFSICVLPQDGVIRIDTPNPLYEDYPYTVQSGGCGDRGEFIHITADFAKEVNTGLVDTVFGPPGKTHSFHSHISPWTLEFMN